MSRSGSCPVTSDAELLSPVDWIDHVDTDPIRAEEQRTPEIRLRGRTPPRGKPGTAMDRGPS